MDSHNSLSRRPFCGQAKGGGRLLADFSSRRAPRSCQARLDGVAYGGVEGASMAVARIQVKLKPTVLDAQGAQIKNALQALGFGEVSAVRAGRYFEVELPNGDNAERDVRAMCEQLLSNPIIETYDYEIEASGPPTAENAG